MQPDLPSADAKSCAKQFAYDSYAKKEGHMLCLTRTPGETIMLDDEIELTILSVYGSTVRVAITAPSKVRIMRKELIEPAPSPCVPALR